MNICVFSGSNPFVVFAKASFQRSCKIQTMCVKTNIRGSFTPPEAMDEDSIKILYYHDQNFMMCQRIVKMNERNKDLSKQMEPDLSGLCSQKIDWQLSRDFYVVYGYDDSHCIYEVEIYSGLSLLQKFERFFEKIPQDSSIAFIFNRSYAGRYAPFFPFFVKALLRHLGRKPPIVAKYDSHIQAWSSKNAPRKDLIAYSSNLNNVKAKFIINLSSNLLSNEQISATRNVTSRYTDIHLPNPSTDELTAMTFLSSDQHKQNHEAYSIHMNNMETYLRKFENQCHID